MKDSNNNDRKTLEQLEKEIEKLRFEREAYWAENRQLKKKLTASSLDQSTDHVRVAYVTMVKNSERMICYHLNYYRNLGIRDFFICDNGSTDRTRALIRQFQNENTDLRIVVLEDPTVGYYQSARMNALVSLAFDYGCNWILPVDDDEILCSSEGAFNLPQFISSRIASDTDAGTINIPCCEYVPSDDDQSTEKNPFLRVRNRESGFSKPNQTVLVRWKKGLVLAQGNHRVSGAARQLLPDNNPLYIAHFPYLDLEHVRHKILQGALAYEAAPDLLPTMGMHWKLFYSRFKRDGDAALTELLDEFKSSKSKLITQPLPANMFD
jgi:glycosyltransferase involved in cell wall biosynthesis